MSGIESAVPPDGASQGILAPHAGRLPSAADIWSAGAEAPALPARTNATAEDLPVSPPAPSEVGTIWQNNAWKVTAARRTDSGQGRIWPPRRLSLALQGGGSFGAFTWGVLDRLLQAPNCEFDAISGASVGAVNAALLASGLVEGGREGARSRLKRFWRRVTDEGSFRSLMLIGGFSPAGTSVTFGRGLSPAQFDPVDLDPLRQALAAEIDFSTFTASACPKLLVAATRVRDGRLQIFRNKELTADVVLASTCPPLIHCAVEIDGEAYWDGSYAANPPIMQLVQDTDASDVLVVQLTPSRDAYVPITMAAIDRRLDQIMANAALNAELAALELARGEGTTPKLDSLKLFRITAEDEIAGLAQRSAVDIGRGFIEMLHRSGRDAAERWLSQGPNDAPRQPGIEKTSATQSA